MHDDTKDLLNCHAKTGPAYNWPWSWTTYGCHNWTGTRARVRVSYYSLALTQAALTQGAPSIFYQTTWTMAAADNRTHRGQYIVHDSSYSTHAQQKLPNTELH